VAHVSRFTAYKYREEDEAFAAKWEEALQASVDRCEEKAFDMALLINGSRHHTILSPGKAPRSAPISDDLSQQLSEMAGIAFSVLPNTRLWA
jgi:hypothetical protein